MIKEAKKYAKNMQNEIIVVPLGFVAVPSNYRGQNVCGIPLDRGRLIKKILLFSM